MGSQKQLIQRWIPSQPSHHNKNTRAAVDSRLQRLVVIEHVLKYAQHVIQVGYVDMIYLHYYISEIIVSYNIILYHHTIILRILHYILNHTTP